MQEKRNMLKIIEKQRGKMFEHLIRHDSFITSIIEEEIERNTKTKLFRLDKGKTSGRTRKSKLRR